MSVTADDFAFVRRLVADESAVALSEDKDYLVHNRLSAVAQREGLGSVAELVAAARAGVPHLRERLVEAMFIHETLFFRDQHPFEALRDVVLPERLDHHRGRRLAVWSAATSTGQEAYSLAMLIREAGLYTADLQLLGTDLSAAALARASAGRFSELEVNRGLPSSLLARYFTPDGREWQLCDEVRSMVRFARLNLARPLPASLGVMDVVLLRNVLIYLDDDSRAGVVRRIADVLAPGGYLILGGSETIAPCDDRFEVVRIGRTTLYRRRGASA